MSDPRGLSAAHISAMLSGLSAEWVTLLGKQLRLPLCAAVTAVATISTDELYPAPAAVMAEFRRVRMNEVRTIIILDSIVDTTAARHDVLILPRSLVSIAAREQLCKGSHHQLVVPAPISAWEDYTRAIVDALAPPRIIAAREWKQEGAGAAATILPAAEIPRNITFDALADILLRRGLPSISRHHGRDDVGAIMTIDATMAALAQMPQPIYLFTDGGCIGNGKVQCRASYGLTVLQRDGSIVYETCGIVPAAQIAGKQYDSSNNRGELFAIHAAFDWISGNLEQCRGGAVIVSDSKYAIMSITAWGPKWLREGTSSDKKNLDIILPLIESHSALLRRGVAVSFERVRGHQREPGGGIASDAWFYWFGNSRADALCGIALGRTVTLPTIPAAAV